MMWASLSCLGVIPLSTQSRQSRNKELLKACLHFFKKMAASPSGPEAAVLDNSSIASIMSFLSGSDVSKGSDV